MNTKIPNILWNQAKLLEGDPGGVPRLKAYQPLRGDKWTIGFGHTGNEVHPGLEWSEQQAEDALVDDLMHALAVVDMYVTVPINENQRSALALFVLNVGAGSRVDKANPGFIGSTLLVLLNQGNYGAVPAQLMRWDKYLDRTDGQLKVSTGLQARRSAEVAIWNTPVQSSAAVPQPADNPTTNAGVEVVPPPQPSSAIDTSTGKAAITIITSGGLAGASQAVQQAQPIIDSVRSIITWTATLNDVARIIACGLVVVCVAAGLWLYHDRNRKVKENGV